MLMYGIKVHVLGENPVIVKETLAPQSWFAWKKVIKWLGDLGQEKAERVSGIFLVELEVKEVEK